MSFLAFGEETLSIGVQGGIDRFLYGQ